MERKCYDDVNYQNMRLPSPSPGCKKSRVQTGSPEERLQADTTESVAARVRELSLTTKRLATEGKRAAMSRVHGYCT